jgi:MFS family permease
MLALSQARGLPPIMLLAGAAGLTSELYRPASSALIADLIPEGQRVTGFALYRLAVNSGSAAGPIVAGFLAGHSFFLLFAGDALTSLLYAAVAAVALPNITAKDHPERASERASGRRRGRLSYERGFLWFIAVSALVSFVYMQAYSTLSLQVRADGLPAAAYGGVISLNGLLIIVAELPLTSITRRIAPRIAMTVGILLIAVGFGLTAFASSLALLALCVVIWTCGEMVNSPVAQAYVASVAPARLRGRYAGAWSAAWSAGTILGSVIGTTVFAWNAQRFWLLCGALGAIAAVTLFLTQRDAGPRGQAQLPRELAISSANSAH